MSFFVGRDRELGLLRRLLHKRSASLVVIKGRRRIGKSRLAREFAREFDRACFLTGLPPTPDSTEQSQRDDFATQMRDGAGSRPELDNGDRVLVQIRPAIADNQQCRMCS